MRFRPVVLMAAALAACSESATSPAPDVTPAFSATAATSSTIVPLTIGAFIDCAADGAGESVTLNGRLHILVHTTVTNDGTVHVKGHFQPQNLSGIGDVTGDRYRGVGVTQDMTTVHPGGFPATFTFINNFRMIGQGAGNNFQVHENAHATINANGEITVDRSNLRVTCG